MAGYKPLKITGPKTGLVQNREEFLLPDDAYPVLQNAYVWRERIKRKKGFQLLGRLQRNLSGVASLSNISFAIAGTYLFNLYTLYGLPTGETNKTIVPLSTIIVINAPISQTLTDTLGTGQLTITGAGPINFVFLNYTTGDLVFTVSGAGVASSSTFTGSYYPGLPVMGIRTRELTNSANDQTVFFDQVYAYTFNSGTSQFQEFLTGTTWNAHGGAVSATDFFWSTNYWVSSTPIFTTTNVKLFWVTNNTGQFGAASDPPRITDGITWVNFTSSTWNQIDATNFLWNFLANLPFRGRMVTFNTWEGVSAASAQNFSNRIRWSTVGDPFIAYTAGPPAAGSWRDDIRGKGGFLDIPTSEDIVAVGFVRDNLVIYTERSTWQLRYTGNSIAPFQIEKVNSELGAESTFAAVQFDTSLFGIGDKGIVECDSYKSERVDIKIPDFVFQFTSMNNGVSRVQGIRDFIERLAYWTIPLQGGYDPTIPSSNWIFPNTRLVYNYENDSWALFNDTLTALGTYQEQSSRTWLNTNAPWIECDFPWINQPQSVPVIVGGNQQGFIEQLNELTVNDISLMITAIAGQNTTPTVITSPNHNLTTGTVIGISGIPAGTPFSNLNGGVFSIILGDQQTPPMNQTNKFRLMKYNSITGQFSTPQLDSSANVYVGYGNINIRDNFSIVSKKFNFLDEGQSIQMGYLDILMSATEPANPGAISLNVYLDYDDVNASNVFPNNQIDNGNEPPTPDNFFNVTIPTTPSTFAVAPAGSKFWQRVFCPTRANFLTLQYTFSNEQMSSNEQQQQVQIDAQILHIRRAGRLTQF